MSAFRTAVAIALLNASCGGQLGNGADGGDAGDASTCGALPTMVSGSPASNGDTLVFAVDQFFMGDMDVDGTVDASAWTAIGFDLDRRNTTDHTSETCSSSTVFTDGQCGVDNNFGALSLKSYVVNRSQAQTTWARSGRWTWLFEIRTFLPSGTFSGLTVQAHVGATLATAPQFDGKDTWPTATGFDSNEAPATIANNVIVASALDVWMDEPLSDAAGALHRLHMPLHASVIRLELGSDLSHVTSGILAGVIDPNEIAGSYLPCTGTDNWNFQTYCDIHRSLQNDPTTPCDAWSFAVAFTATRVSLGTSAAPMPPPTDCKSP